MRNVQLNVYEREDIKTIYRMENESQNQRQPEAVRALEKQGILPRLLILKRNPNRTSDEPMLTSDYQPWREFNSLGPWIEMAVDMDIPGTLYKGISLEGAERASMIRTGAGLTLNYEELVDRVNKVLLI